VSDPLALRARRVRALFLCRMHAGSFPALERRAPLLGEEERRGLAQTAALRISEPRDALADERYLLYAALSRPQDALVLSWHERAEDGTPRTRSQFIDEVCDLFEGAPATLEAPPAPHAAVHAARLTEGATPRGTTAAPVAQSTSSAPLAGAGARESNANIAPDELLPAASEHVWSASSLGTWMSCPMRWFVERVLCAEDLDPRAEPLARGLLAHAALKDTFEALERETGSARVTRANLNRAREHLAAALREYEAELPLSAERERVPALQRRLRADLERYLEHAAAVAEEEDAAGGGEPPEPRYLELEFGLGEDGLPPLDLGGGVKVRGRIDRVDVRRDGEAVVYDYKGRSATPAAKWLERSEVQVALYMRAVEQLLGLRPIGGFYQPLSGELRARGVLDADSGVQLPVVSSDRRDASELRELLEQAVAAAREAAAQAARGELAARPQTCSPRGGCAYPAICRCTC
jgi:ATP-dependent helicase/DNAse subunit B